MSEAKVDMKMTSDRSGITESGKVVNPGAIVEYIAHVLGGMVKVKMSDGSFEIMHPNCFPRLR